MLLLRRKGKKKEREKRGSGGEVEDRRSVRLLCCCSWGDGELGLSGDGMGEKGGLRGDDDGVLSPLTATMGDVVEEENGAFFFFGGP